MKRKALVVLISFVVLMVIVLMCSLARHVTKTDVRGFLNVEKTFPSQSDDITAEDVANATRFSEKTGITLNFSVPQHKKFIKDINHISWFSRNEINKNQNIKISMVAFRNDEFTEGEYQMIAEIEYLNGNWFCTTEQFRLYSSDFAWDNISSEQNSCVVFNKSKTYFLNAMLCLGEDSNKIFNTSSLGIEYNVPSKPIQKYKDDLVMFNGSIIQLWGIGRIKNYSEKEQMIDLSLEYGRNNCFVMNWDNNESATRL